MKFSSPIKNNASVLALGAESAGNFSILEKEAIYFSKDFGDLIEEENWINYKKAVMSYLKTKHIRPTVILSDLHPLFNTTLLGQELAQTYNTQYLQVQHHFAHIFSALGDRMLQDKNYRPSETIYGIACDGTGYGMDENIWGGEIFEIKNKNAKIKSLKKIGRLENQILIGGELAIKEPARMLLSILGNFLDKKEVQKVVKKYYSENEFELPHNQLQQNFNCLKTSSAGRILDAVSILLGFCKNTRKYKHEPINLLGKNSTKPFADLKPEIIRNKNNCHILNTTLLFSYLYEHFSKKDPRRLAATAQSYIAEGLYEIIKKNQATLKSSVTDIYFSGGLANNKILSKYLESKGAYVSKKIPRGDAGLSFGQIIYYLLTK